LEPPGESSVPRGIEELGAAYRSGTTTPTSATRECLSRIKSLNPSLNAFITVLADSARKAAEESQIRLKAGAPIGPLDGIPIAVKDIIYIEGVKCTAGSKILANNVASYDAPVVKGLKAAGAVIIGTTNLHEFAAGVTSVNPHYGAVRNPWDQGMISGGSSGGSAVAVATGMAAGALGTDTGGSIRIPSALCGVLGLKPTYGLVSRLGVVPLSSSLDTVGVLALRAWDAAALLQAIARHEKDDLTTVGSPAQDVLSTLAGSASSFRIGVVRDYFQDLVVPNVERNFEEFISKVKTIGCSVGEAKLDGISEVYERWLPIRRAEATAFHLKWLESAPELYGKDVRKLLEQGRDVLAVDYINAVNARPSHIEKFLSSMGDFDILAAPCTCIPAPEIEQTSVEIRGKEVPIYSALNRLTLPFNYVGLPVMSIPSGLVNGLPLGVQIVGKLFDEASLLRFAATFEKTFGPFAVPHLGNPTA
jgi:aspartyl-tRNA(Asn)/glutamyl-tRNA(Gln) amidotransferase subunit A